MRKLLDLAAFLLLVFTSCLTAWEVFGPHPLPAKIPTHFNAAGQADGWGTPGMLWLLPIIAGIIFALMTAVARYPGAFHFPGRTHPAARMQMEAMALSMIGWLKAEVMGLFAWVQGQTLRLARSGEGTLPFLFLPAVLVVVFGTIAWHVAAMRRLGRGNRAI